MFSIHDELIGPEGVYRNQGICHDAEYGIMIDRAEGHRLKKATLKLAWKHLFDNHGSQADGVGNKWYGTIYLLSTETA